MWDFLWNKHGYVNLLLLNLQRSKGILWWRRLFALRSWLKSQRLLGLSLGWELLIVGCWRVSWVCGYCCGDVHYYLRIEIIPITTTKLSLCTSCLLILWAIRMSWERAWVLGLDSDSIFISRFHLVSMLVWIESNFRGKEMRVIPEFLGLMLFALLVGILSMIIGREVISGRCRRIRGGCIFLRRRGSAKLCHIQEGLCWIAFSHNSVV